MKTWLTVSDAADYAGVSRDTIYTACERREMRPCASPAAAPFGCGRDGSTRGSERHPSDVHDRRPIGDTQNGATS